MIADVGQTGPLSYAQQRVYFVHQWDPGAASYVFPVNLRLRGPLDRLALNRALGDLVDRHAVLRSTVVTHDGVPVQVVGPNQFRLHFTDLRPGAGPDLANRLRRAQKEQAHEPFDLSATLFKGRLLALADDDHVLLLSFHHICFDGWSASVLAAELDSGYRRHIGEAQDQLEAPSFQYLDFARRERARLNGQADAGMAAYWRRRLTPLPARLELPTTRPRPEVLSGRTARVWRHLTPALTDAVDRFARERRATPYMVLMTAFQVVLAHHSGCDDFCVGGATAGRTADTYPLIGMFVNQVVYRSDHTSEVSASDLLARVRANALLAYKNDRLPFERLVELLAPERSLGYHPLFQHAVVLQPSRQGDDGFRLAGLTVEAFEAPAEGSALDLSVSFHLNAGALHMAVDFSTDLWDPDWPSLLANDLVDVLMGFVTQPNSRADAALAGRRYPTSRLNLATSAAQSAKSRPANESPPDDAGINTSGEAELARQRSAGVLLAVLWADALGLNVVDHDDNFFDIGGDSLLALQIVAKAQAAGFNLRVRDLFRYQTIRTLGPALLAAGPTNCAVERPEGVAPLLPVQDWFLSADDVDAGQYNYTILYRVAAPVDHEQLAQAVHLALQQHDAVRLRFHRTEAGSWKQTYTAGEGFEPVEHIDLAHVGEVEAAAAVVREAERIQGMISLQAGPLVRTAHIVVSNDDHRLLVVAHHLVMDPASARIIADDVTTAFHQLAHGQTPELLAPRCTFGQWGRALQYFAASEQVTEELTYWRRVLSTPDVRLPVESPTEVNDVASQRTIEFELDANVTRALRHDVTAAEDATLTELLLAALGSALYPWTGGADVLIDLETSGREDVLDVDASRTVGWFTAMFPFALATAPTIGTSLVQRVRQEYRLLPRKGLGYGLLSRTTCVLPTWDAELGFTYMGAFDVHNDATEMLLTVLHLPPESDRYPTMRRRQEIEVGAAIVRGQLGITITYSTSRWSRQAMEEVGQAALWYLRSIAEQHATS